MKFSREPDLDDPMKWAGGQYRFDTAEIQQRCDEEDAAMKKTSQPK